MSNQSWQVKMARIEAQGPEAVERFKEHRKKKRRELRERRAEEAGLPVPRKYGDPSIAKTSEKERERSAAASRASKVRKFTREEEEFLAKGEPIRGFSAFLQSKEAVLAAQLNLPEEERLKRNRERQAQRNSYQRQKSAA